MNTHRSLIFKALAAAILVAIVLPAGAEGNERHGRMGMHGDFRGGDFRGGDFRGGDFRGGDFRGGDFRGGGDIRHFDRHDYAVWRSGGWRHDWHDGRLGWWWVVGGLWYFYPEPVYPYPDPYIPPVVVTQPAPQPEPPQAQFWYFCDASNAYYPYVSSCPGGWKAVPASPPAVAPNTPPSTPAQQ